MLLCLSLPSASSKTLADQVDSKLAPIAIFPQNFCPLKKCGSPNSRWSFSMPKICRKKFLSDQNTHKINALMKLLCCFSQSIALQLFSLFFNLLMIKFSLMCLVVVQ